MSARSYLVVAAVVWACLSMACIALSVFADPYRMFATPAIPGLTALKPRIYEQAALAKTYQLERVRPRTLLLGNSRVENGFDPQSEVWPKSWQPVFNAGLAGEDLFMAWRMLQEAVAAGPVKNVIVAVDFPDFLTQPVPGGPPLPAISDDERRLLVARSGGKNAARQLQVWRDRMASTLTIDALTDSLITLADQNPDASVTMRRQGFNPLHEYAADIANIGYHGLFAQKIAAYRERFKTYPHPDFSRPTQIEDFTYLVRIIHTAAERHDRLILFIPPYHQTLLGIIDDTGLWLEFESWKRALVRVVETQKRSLGLTARDIELVDFSGYNAYTMEPVPAKNDLHAQTRWYWEPGHYKASLGDVVLARLISGTGDFGYLLTPDTIEETLARERLSAVPSQRQATH